MEEKIGLHFVSPTRGSIYEISNGILSFLEKEFSVTKEWLFEIPTKRDILLCHFLDPDVMSKVDIFDTFKTKILIQPIDGTNIKSECIKAMNGFNLIITPASAGKKIMENNGVTSPIIVIPNFYKEDFLKKDIFSPIENYIPTNKIIFYHESTFHPRKGVELLYECFIRAFSNVHDFNNVALVLKDIPYNNLTFDKNEQLKRDAIRLQETYIYTPEIIKFSAGLDESEMKALWNKTNIYVSLAKIEGFGIPMLRMHLLNKPIICLRNQNSGYNDYLNDSNSYMIDTLQIDAEDEFMWLYEKETKWAVPNIQDGVKIFRKCYNDYINGISKSLNLKSSEFENYFKNYSLPKIANNYIEKIKEEFNNANYRS